METDMDWSLGFIGAGVMAEVMIAGLLEERILPAGQITASDRNPERAAHLAAQYGIQGTANNGAAATADIVVLSVKPQTLGVVLAELRGKIPADTVVVSIVAGATVATIRKGLDHAKVVRTMPNLPCKIRRGMTVWNAPADTCLLYTSPSPRDLSTSRMPSSA